MTRLPYEIFEIILDYAFGFDYYYKNKLYDRRYIIDHLYYTNLSSLASYFYKEVYFNKCALKNTRKRRRIMKK